MKDNVDTLIIISNDADNGGSSINSGYAYNNIYIDDNDDYNYN